MHLCLKYTALGQLTLVSMVSSQVQTTPDLVPLQPWVQMQASVAVGGCSVPLLSW